MRAACNFRPERIWIAFQSSFHRFSSSSFIFHIVIAIYTIATITIYSRSKTFTISAQDIQTLASHDFTIPCNKNQKHNKKKTEKARVFHLQLQAFWMFTIALFLLFGSSFFNFKARPRSRLWGFWFPEKKKKQALIEDQRAKNQNQFKQSTTP